MSLSGPTRLFTNCRPIVGCGVKNQPTNKHVIYILKDMTQLEINTYNFVFSCINCSKCVTVSLDFLIHHLTVRRCMAVEGRCMVVAWHKYTWRTYIHNISTPGEHLVSSLMFKDSFLSFIFKLFLYLLRKMESVSADNQVCFFSGVDGIYFN